MDKSLMFFIAILINNFSFGQVLTDEQLFENSIMTFRSTNQIFDSIILNYNNKNSMQFSLSQFDTIYYYNENDLISKDVLSKYLFKNRIFVPIDNIWLDSVGITVGENVRKKEPKVLFNGVIVYKLNRQSDYSWETFIDSKRDQAVDNSYRNLKKSKFPIFYGVKINNQLFNIHNDLKTYFELYYRNDSLLLSGLSSPISFNYSVVLNRRFSLKRRRCFFRYQNRTISVVYRGNNILYYQAFSGGPFSSSKKVKPRKGFKKLI
jgi:hypothetical protein